jgi:hypothetical protein
MNQRISIQTVEVCDSNKDTFPNETGVFTVPFSPAPLGSTGSIFVKLSCTLDPDGQAEVLYTLKINTPDFEFNMGDGKLAKYIRQAADNVDIFLPLEISNTKPIGSPNTIPSFQITISAKDTSPNSPRADGSVVTIISKN